MVSQKFKDNLKVKGTCLAIGGGMILMMEGHKMTDASAICGTALAMGGLVYGFFFMNKKSVEEPQMKIYSMGRPFEGKTEDVAHELVSSAPLRKQPKVVCNF